MADDVELAENDTAICELCTEGLVVRTVRTGREFFGPFWRLAWTHADPQPGTDGTRCWAPPPRPKLGTIRRSVDFERPTGETAVSGREDES